MRKFIERKAFTDGMPDKTRNSESKDENKGG